MAGSDLQLANELLTLRRENRRLRYASDERAEERRRARQVRMIEQAGEDAKLLVAWAYALHPISRAESPLSQHRWARAVALLRLARLTRRGRGPVRIEAYRAEIIAKRLDHALNTAKRDPSALTTFLAPTRRNRTLE